MFLQHLRIHVELTIHVFPLNQPCSRLELTVLSIFQVDVSSYEGYRTLPYLTLHYLTLPYLNILFIFCRSDSSHVPVDTVHPSLLRSSSLSSPRWYKLQSLSSDVFLVSPHDVSKPPQYCFPAPLCGVLYLKSVPDVIVSHMVSSSFFK